MFARPHAELAPLLASASGLADALATIDASLDRESVAACIAGIQQSGLPGDMDVHTLFSSVARWALAALQEPPPDVSPSAAPSSRHLTARQCRGILANALLGNVNDSSKDHKRRSGGLSWRRMLMDNYGGIGPEKVRALLLYFQRGLALEGTADDDRVIVWERHRTPSADALAAKLEACDATLVDEGAAPPSVLLHDGVMEAAPLATAFVNFANREFGYGAFINSCTQEEILQVCCPEFNVGMCWIGSMRDDEVVVVRRCRRFSTYSGYLGSFRCTGTLEADVVQDILTIDACTAAHFEPHSMLRDIGKAYTAFAALAHGGGAPAAPAVVSTGRWGCGVFGGTPSHKFMQQLIAARLAGVPLEFSTFGTPDGCDAVLAALRARPISVARAWALLLLHRERRAFDEMIVRAIGGGASYGASGRAVVAGLAITGAAAAAAYASFDV